MDISLNTSISFKKTKLSNINLYFILWAPFMLVQSVVVLPVKGATLGYILALVSIEWNELKLLNSPALLASNKDEFITALKHVLSDDRGDGVYREYARGNSWMGRVECIEKLIRDEK
jgi:hypothetical protein